MGKTFRYGHVRVEKNTEGVTIGEQKGEQHLVIVVFQ